MTDGEIMKGLAERKDCGEFDMWQRAHCWYYGIPYIEDDDLYIPEVEHDFGVYINSLFQNEVTPPYVKSFARTFKITFMEA